MDRMEKIVRLPETKNAAIKYLLCIQKDTVRMEDELNYFQLYLNYAVNNIQQISGLPPELFKESSVEQKLRDINNKNPQKIQALANFLWLFKIDEPDRDFKNYTEQTIAVVKKIYELRNFFTHPENGSVDPLLTNRNLYVFLEGILGSEARDYAMEAGVRMDKIFKLKLLNRHQDKDDRYYAALKEFEFTRKGIIFLTCLALYRDEAMEFCQLFKDMRLPEKCQKGGDPEGCDGNCPAQGNTCNLAKAKGLREFFTCFSCRRGRDVLNAADIDYMCFSDIVTYLNKVPAPSFDYLALNNETNMLADLEKKSTESMENREFKYKIHRRFRNRFLSFAAAYCEDFDKIPALKFKRQDISTDPGRKRYIFGSENDNRVRMDRHYAIQKDSIAFSYEPKEHYGAVKIGSLRSSINESEFKKLLFIGEKIGYDNVNSKLEEYFSAYHRILERMLNYPEDEDFLLDDDMIRDFMTVSHEKSEDMLIDNFEEILTPFFPENMTRFFVQDDKIPDAEAMCDALDKRFSTLKNRASDFLTRAETFRDWKRSPLDKDGKHNPPSPPVTSRISDGEMIQWVFRYFNLFLAPKDKFRQLPLGKQHREGTRDHEYQLLHAAIGKFSLDQQGLGKLLMKMRSSLEDKYIELVGAGKKADEKPGAIGEFLEEEKEYLKEHPRYLKNGSLVKASKTLLMLAQAAATLYMKYCEKAQKKWENCDPYSVDLDELRTTCRKFGIKTGMPLDRKSLVKTILRLDMDQWERAYDYENGSKREKPRTLDSVMHIVSQVPLPCGFADRVIEASVSNNQWKPLFVDGKFDFNLAIRQRAISPVTLRDYYNVTPLIEYMRTKKMNTGLNPEVDFGQTTRNTLNHIRGEIKKIENQDRLLLLFALAYRERALEHENDITIKVKAAKGTSIYDYFDTPVIYETTEGKINLYPNDLTRPAFSIIRSKKNIRDAVFAFMKADPVFVKTLGPDGSWSFYRVLEAWRILQASDRRKRLEILPLLCKFEDRVVQPNFDNSLSKEEKRKRLYGYYKNVYRDLTMEEFELLIDTRNAVCHDGVALDIEPAKAILKRVIRDRKPQIRTY